MKLYIPAPAAQAMSNALWSLSRPAIVRKPADVTRFLFPWVEATDRSQWLVVDTEYEINVHQEASLVEIAVILQPYITAGQLEADTNTQLAALVESKRGSRLVVYEAFPQFFKDQAKTYQQMVNEGLFKPLIMP